jgi:hypothetical protein
MSFGLGGTYHCWNMISGQGGRDKDSTFTDIKNAVGMVPA